MFLLVFLILSVTVNIYGQDNKLGCTIKYEVLGGNIELVDFNIYSNDKAIGAEHYYAIDLSKRNIVKIISFTGKSCSDLNELDLRNNKIKIIDTRTFKKLKRLDWLALNENPIKVIKKDSFKELKLTQLKLPNNIKKILEKGALCNLDKVKIQRSKGENYCSIRYDDDISEKDLEKWFLCY